MTKVVFGIASNNSHADRIVNRLQQAGFTNEEISVLASDKEGKVSETDVSEFGTIESPTTKTKKGTFGHEKHTKAPEGGVTGAVAGGIIGGSIGLLAGLGALAIPGLGMFIAAGPIVAALSGSGIGGAAGLLVGALVGLGIPEYEAKKYETQIKDGGILIAIHAEDNNATDLANQVLEQENAKDISTSREKAGSR